VYPGIAPAELYFPFFFRGIIGHPFHQSSGGAYQLPDDSAGTGVQGMLNDELLLIHKCHSLG